MTQHTVPARTVPHAFLPLLRLSLFSALLIGTAAALPAQPDLVVRRIAAAPHFAVAGESVRFSAVIENVGTEPTPSGVIHGVLFRVDGNPVTWAASFDQSLSPGQRTEVTASGGPLGSAFWTATAGSHSLQALVDDVDRIPGELSETNNAFETGFLVAQSAGQPDLVVEEVRWVPRHPGPGEAVRFEAVVSNRGSAPTPSEVVHGVSFWVNGMPVSWSDFFTSSIAPGGSVLLKASGGPSGSPDWIASKGLHALEAHVDDVDRIGEGDESNNRITAELIVDEARPDLVVADIDWSPGAPDAGESVIFSATLANIGRAPTPTGAVHEVIFRVNGALVSWASSHTASIPAGGFAVVHATGGPAGSPAWLAVDGSHGVEAVVDPENRIQGEQDEANNQRMEILTLGASGEAGAWIGRDVGGPSLPGSHSFDPAEEQFALAAGGTDIWDRSDQFYFLQQSLPAGGAIAVRVSGLQADHAWAKAGVMIRQTLEADSAHAMAVITPGNGAAFQRRASSGDLTRHTAAWLPLAAPVWLMLTRSDTQVTAYFSEDGIAWQTLGQDSVALDGAVSVGLILTSHDPSLRAHAVFQEVLVIRDE